MLWWESEVNVCVGTIGRVCDEEMAGGKCFGCYGRVCTVELMHTLLTHVHTFTKMHKKTSPPQAADVSNPYDCNSSLMT